MKKKTATILSSCAAIAVCSSLIAGSTYALFTSEDKVNIAVTAGKVAVTATVDKESLALTSMNEAQDGKNWANGGTAGFNSKDVLELENITPGDGASFNITVKNESTVNVKYKINWLSEGELADALTVTSTVGGDKLSRYGSWTEWTVDEDDVKTITVSVKLPEGAGNDVQGETASLGFYVEAYQANAALTAGNEYTVRSGADLVEAVDMAQASNVESVINLESDVRLSKELHIERHTADLTINGNGHKISALSSFTVGNDHSQNNLIKLDANSGKVTLNDVTLEHGYIAQEMDYYHTLDVYGCNEVVLNNVTATRNIENGVGGAPLVINGSSVTATDLTLNAGGTSWYGANVDQNGQLNVQGGFAYNVLDNDPLKCAVRIEDGDLTVNSVKLNGEYFNCVDGELVALRLVVVTTQEQFEAAIADVQENDVISLAPGTYKATADKQLDITKNNVILAGAGKEYEAETIIDCGEHYAVKDQAALHFRGNNVAVANLTVKSSINNGNVVALKFSNVRDDLNCVIKNVTVYSEKSNGVSIHGVTNAIVDNVTVAQFGKCGFAVAHAKNVEFTNCTVEKGGWGYDIGCMYKTGSENNYKIPSHIVIGEGNDFKNGWIYGEHPLGDTVEYDATEWEITYKANDFTEEEVAWDLKKI